MSEVSISLRMTLAALQLHVRDSTVRIRRPSPLLLYKHTLLTSFQLTQAKRWLPFSPSIDRIRVQRCSFIFLFVDSARSPAMSKARHQGKPPPPLENEEDGGATTGSDSGNSDDDEAILRLASVGKQHGNGKSATNDDEDDSHPATHLSVKQRRPPTAADKKKAAAHEEWADKLAAKQEKRLAGNVEKGRVITVKQERQRTMKQAEESSGVASALQQLAQKKKQKEKMRKIKKQQRKQSEDDDDDEDEDVEEDGGSGDEDDDGEDGEDEEREEEQEEETDVEKVHYETLDEEIAAYRDQHSISITHSLLPSAASSGQLHSDPLYYPLRSFADLHTQFSLPHRLTSALISPSFTQPTPIQAQVWPLILAGKDVVGVASTGSGKTLGFLLGALVYMCKKRGWLQKLDDPHFTPPAATTASTASSSPSPPTPLVLILSPTRELALQTFQIAQEACSTLGLTTMSLVGGPSIEGQLALLQSSPPDIIVATPGRLQKHLAASSLSLGSCGYVVLDEADRMLDLGFHDAIMTILSTLPAAHQTLLFSATWPPAISDVAMTVMRKEKVMKVNVGSDDLTAAKSVKQIVEVVDRRNGGRERQLMQLLAEHPPSAQSLLLVFCLYKRESQQLADYLNRHQHPALPLNSSFSHSQRTQTLASFRSGNPPILVATDVAARGLDISNIRTVVCFSVGLSVEAWVHRVGRCGRGGQRGTAYTFVVDWDVVHAPGLVRLLTESGSAVSEELREMAERGQRRADKHQEEAGLTGERLIVARLKKGGKEREREEEEEDVEERIFGKNQSAARSVLQQGKKQHVQAGGKKQGRGGRRGGKS